MYGKAWWKKSTMPKWQASPRTAPGTRRQSTLSDRRLRNWVSFPQSRTHRRFIPISSCRCGFDCSRVKAFRLDCLGDRLAARNGVGVAAEVASAQSPLREHALDRFYDGAAGFPFAEMIKHHGTRPDLADRIGD